MGKPEEIFLSYSHHDSKLARSFREALERRGWGVFLDVRSINAGADFSERIEQSIRDARGLVALITRASAESPWVMYEFALARGAGVPAFAVVQKGTEIPAPMKRFHALPLSPIRTALSEIERVIGEEARDLGRRRAAEPRLVAKFQEINGRLRFLPGKAPRAIWMDLWIEGAPSDTKSVSVEILDESFVDGPWTVKQERGGTLAARPFLTDDLSSWGDVEIAVRGSMPRRESWAIRSTLYEALVRFYRSRPVSKEIEAALRQIETY